MFPNWFINIFIIFIIMMILPAIIRFFDVFYFYIRYVWFRKGA